MATDPKKNSKNVTRVLRAQKLAIDAKIDKQKEKQGEKAKPKKSKGCKKGTSHIGIAYYKQAKAKAKKKSPTKKKESKKTKTVKESFEGYIKHLLKESFKL